MAFGSIVMTKLAVDLGMNPLLAIGCRAAGLRRLRVRSTAILITLVQLPPFIVTLGTLNIAFALTHIYSQAQTVSGLPGRA